MSPVTTRTSPRLKTASEDGPAKVRRARAVAPASSPVARAPSLPDFRAGRARATDRARRRDRRDARASRAVVSFTSRARAASRRLGVLCPPRAATRAARRVARFKTSPFCRGSAPLTPLALVLSRALLQTPVEAPPPAVAAEVPAAPAETPAAPAEPVFAPAPAPAPAAPAEQGKEDLARELTPTTLGAFLADLDRYPVIMVVSKAVIVTVREYYEKEGWCFEMWPNELIACAGVNPLIMRYDGSKHGDGVPAYGVGQVSKVQDERFFLVVCAAAAGDATGAATQQP